MQANIMRFGERNKVKPAEADFLHYLESLGGSKIHLPGCTVEKQKIEAGCGGYHHCV